MYVIEINTHTLIQYNNNIFRFILLICVVNQTFSKVSWGAVQHTIAILWTKSLEAVLKKDNQFKILRHPVVKYDNSSENQDK